MEKIIDFDEYLDYDLEDEYEVQDYLENLIVKHNDSATSEADLYIPSVTDDDVYKIIEKIYEDNGNAELKEMMMSDIPEMRIRLNEIIDGYDADVIMENFGYEFQEFVDEEDE